MNNDQNPLNLPGAADGGGRIRRAVRVEQIPGVQPPVQLPSATQQMPLRRPTMRPIQANPPINPQNTPTQALHQLNNPHQYPPIPQPQISIDQQAVTADPNVELNSKEKLAQFETMPTAGPPTDEYIPYPRISRKLTGNQSRRLVLPSECIFYPFKDVEIRPFNFADLADLAAAVKNDGGDLVAINDVINRTVNIDIRELWVQDLRYILYWLRLNSFTKIPYKVKWTSFYGNINEIQVRDTDIATTRLRMTEQQYRDWQAKGFAVPTVRDEEEFNSLAQQTTEFKTRDKFGKEIIEQKPKISEADKFIFERTQFLAGGSVLQRIELGRDPDFNLDLLIDIKEFSHALQQGGVQESLQAYDQHFKLDVALPKLKQELEEIDNILNTDMAIPISAEELLQSRRDKTQQEINRLEHCLAIAGEAAPMRETIPLSLTVYDFFPGI